MINKSLQNVFTLIHQIKLSNFKKDMFFFLNNIDFKIKNKELKWIYSQIDAVYSLALLRIGKS